MYELIQITLVTCWRNLDYKHNNSTLNYNFIFAFQAASRQHPLVGSMLNLYCWNIYVLFPSYLKINYFKLLLESNTSITKWYLDKKRKTWYIIQLLVSDVCGREQVLIYTVTAKHTSTSTRRGQKILTWAPELCSNRNIIRVTFLFWASRVHQV